jgi:hypothetical protein
LRMVFCVVRISFFLSLQDTGDFPILFIRHRIAVFFYGG